MRLDPTPYATLTPDRALDAIEAAGWRCDGRLLALNSYENRVYQVGLEDGGFLVTKFYRAGRWSSAAILEEHAFVAELAAAELPAVPPLRQSDTTLFVAEDLRFAVFPRAGGRAPETDDPSVLRWLGRLLARIHQVSGRQPFTHRPALNATTFGDDAATAVLSSGLLPCHLESTYRQISDTLIATIRDHWAAVSPHLLRLHGDCYPGNVLWTDAGPHFVDFDDARMGPAIQDLWMLAPEGGAAFEYLLEGYLQMRAFDDNERLLIEPLRSLRLLHYAGWLAKRWQDPAFPTAFPWFATPRYWDEHLDTLRRQQQLLDGDDDAAA